MSEIFPIYLMHFPHQIDPQYGRGYELVQGGIERKGRLCS